MAGPAPQTMIYTVEHDGKVFDVEGPPNATPEQLQAFVSQGASPAPANDAGVQASPEAPAGLDNRGTVLEGQFGDDPNRVSSRMSPEDEAHITQLLQQGQDDAAREYAASKGFNFKPGSLEAIQKGRAATGKVNSDAVYELAKVKSTPASAVAGGIVDAVPGSKILGAAVDTVGEAIKGGGTPEAGWLDTYDRLLDTNRAQSKADEEEHPGFRLAGQLFGSLAVPVGLEGVGLKAGSEVLRAGGSMAEARLAARMALARRGARNMGAYGAAHGAGNADSIPEALTGAVTEGALGAVAGAAAPLLAPLASKIAGAPVRAARSATDLVTGSMAGRTASPELAPFVKEGVPALAADVGGISSRMGTGFANMTLGGIPLAEAAEKSVAAARALRSSIAERIGSPSRDIQGRSDNLGAGLAAQRGVKAGIGTGAVKEATGERLYSEIPIPADAAASLANSRMALSDMNAGLQSNEELSKLIQDSRLQAYQRAFDGATTDVPTGILGPKGEVLTRPVTKGGNLSWGDLKQFRSYVGELKGRPTLQDSTSQAALGRLYGALSEDMRATAAGVGPKALAKFTRANSYWRGLEARREEVLKPLLGNDMSLSGEAAFNRIQQWATADRGNANVFALGRALRSMPAEEANNIRATIFDRIGNVAKGRNDAEGMVFSPNDFVTHWNGLSGRAKGVLFPGAEYRDSIDRLVSIAASQKGAQQYANVSKTGNAVNGAALLAGFFANPLVTLPIALGQIGFGKVMASPRFANWLASSVSKPNPAAALAHVNRLARIATAEPTIANEVLELQQRLAEAFTSPPTRLAADESDRHRDRIGDGHHDDEEQGSPEQRP